MLLISRSSYAMAKLAWLSIRWSAAVDSEASVCIRSLRQATRCTVLTCQRAAQVRCRHADKVLRRAHHFLQPRVAGQLHKRLRMALHHGGRPVLLLLSRFRWVAPLHPAARLADWRSLPADAVARCCSATFRPPASSQLPLKTGRSGGMGSRGLRAHMHSGQVHAGSRAKPLQSHAV